MVMKCQRFAQLMSSVVALALAVSTDMGWAGYAERPIKMIVPWAAGGDTDAIKRVFGSYLEKHVGVPVVVSNITGASGTVGAREAKNAPPDGYTIYSTHDYIHTTYYTGVSDINYWDFEPICLITATPSILAAYGKAKWTTMQELLADAKQRPNEIKVGATLGSTSHFFPALIAREAKVTWKYVSYEGTAPRMTALLGGHIELGETNLTQLDKVKAGQLKMLAIATDKRHAEVPELPTLKELGINVVYAVNRGLVAPKGTSREILATLEDSCAKVAKEPRFAEAMQKQGTDVQFLNRAAYANFLKANDALNKELSAELGYQRK
jgi:tripartite-type tricarboxylate transporter receptor subunit TctC